MMVTWKAFSEIPLTLPGIIVKIKKSSQRLLSRLVRVSAQFLRTFGARWPETDATGTYLVHIQIYTHTPLDNYCIKKTINYKIIN